MNTIESESSSTTITAAELLRRQMHRGKSDDEIGKNNVSERESKQSTLDLDDEIARLEAELANDSDSSDSDESSSSTTDEEVKDGNENESRKSRNAAAGGIISLSSFRDERIEKLPNQYLPAPAPSKHNKNKKRKKKKNGDHNEDSDENSCKRVNKGLEHAVQHVLNGYVARSAEKLPFYCRVCQKQYSNQDEFFNHKSQDFHLLAVETERKASYCKLCRKQFTSPAQMKEHLSSKPHKERLQRVSNNNGPRHQTQSRRSNYNNKKETIKQHSYSQQPNVARGSDHGGTSRRQWV